MASNANSTLKEITNFWSDWNEISNKSLRWFSNRKKQCGFKNPVASGLKMGTEIHVITMSKPSTGEGKTKL
jgi:hypothetical protein